MKQLEESYQRHGPFDGILIAFSGGADSVSLLHTLKKLQDKLSFRLHAIHINHGLRDNASFDESFAKKLCGELNIPIHIKKLSSIVKGNIENEARKARYQFFMDALQQHQLQTVALAHHANDQAESVLMHLMRGAGSNGLAGMCEYNNQIWRPFLKVKRKQIIEYLQENSLEWVEDESNADKSYFRNALRHSVLPIMDQINPASIDNISRTADILYQERIAWTIIENQWLSRYGKINPPFVFAENKALLQAPLGLQRRIVRALCSIYHIYLDYEQTDRLLNLVQQGEKGFYNLPDNVSAFISEKRLHILSDKVELLKDLLPEISILPFTGNFGDGYKQQAVNKDVMIGSVFRQALPSDVIKPLGMIGTQPLRKYFNGKKVDEPLRKFWPVLAWSNEVLWVPGLGISQLAAVRTNEFENVLLEYRGLLPDEIESEN